MESVAPDNSIAQHFNDNEVIQHKMPTNSIDLPTSTYTSKMDNLKKIEHSIVEMKKYIDDTMLQYGIAVGVILISVLVNILIIMLMTR